MGKMRFTEEQIANVLRLADSGEAIAEICRHSGISRQAFYNWRKKRQETVLRRRLKMAEEENFKLKQLVTDLYLEKKVFSSRASNEEQDEHSKHHKLSMRTEPLKEIDSCAFVPADH